MKIRVIGELLFFSAMSRDDTGEGEGSNVWLDCIDVWVATLVKCLSEWEARGGRRKKL